MTTDNGRRIDQAFAVGLIFKFVDGTVEVIGGLLLWWIGPAALNNLVESYAHTDLSLTHGSVVFGAIYLLSHGLVKVVLVTQIWRHRLWAYAGLIVVTGAFIIYQTYAFFAHHQSSYLWLDAYDLAILVLTWIEYRKMRAKTSALGGAAGKSAADDVPASE